MARSQGRMEHSSANAGAYRFQATPRNGRATVLLLKRLESSEQFYLNRGLNPHDRERK